MITDGETFTFQITEKEAEIRLDLVLSDRYPQYSRSYFQKLFEDGYICCNQRKLSKKSKLSTGNEVCVFIPAPKEILAKPQNIPLDIVYEDEDLLVVNKQKGMVVHPAPGNPDGTLVNALLYYCKGKLSGINGAIRPGILHRLDKDTSGLLLVAKNDKAHLALAEQIKTHDFTRYYQAVVYGHFSEKQGRIKLPIGRSQWDRKKMAVTTIHARDAITEYSVIQEYSGFSHLSIELKTGRTHQIRVHMAYIGHPVAGDAVYGVKKVITCLNGQCLHAKKIGFVHPSSRQWIEFDSDLPEYFQSFLKSLT